MLSTDPLAAWYPEIGRLIVAFGNVEQLVTIMSRSPEVPRKPKQAPHQPLKVRLERIEQHIATQPYLSDADRADLIELIACTRTFADDRRNIVAHSPICTSVWVSPEGDKTKTELSISDHAGHVEPLPLTELIASRVAANDLARRWRDAFFRWSDARLKHAAERAGDQ